MQIEQGNDWFLPFREGKEGAFRQLFDDFYPKIRYFAGNFLKDDDLYLEDIANEAFRKAWEARTKFERPKHVENFLYFVTRNDCLNYLKDRKLKKTSFKEWSHLLDIREDDSQLDLERVQTSSIEIINAALETLPGGDVLRMIFFQNKSTKEIAEELKTTENNVYTIKSRALKALRTKLPKDIWLFFVLFVGGL
jgi:RNA polymerase sigma factor (sigma-70 family)